MHSNFKKYNRIQNNACCIPTCKSTCVLAQIYVFGGKVFESRAWSDANQSDILTSVSVANDFFLYDVSKQTWQRLPDGPPSTALYDFVFLSFENQLILHGGSSSEGETKATLWQVQLFKDSSLDPQWYMLGGGGIGARKQHCAAEVNGTVFFWGGKSGKVHASGCFYLFCHWLRCDHCFLHTCRYVNTLPGSVAILCNFWHVDESRRAP